jgi:hypothetical protein
VVSASTSCAVRLNPESSHTNPDDVDEVFCRQQGYSPFVLVLERVESEWFNVAVVNSGAGSGEYHISSANTAPPKIQTRMVGQWGSEIRHNTRIAERAPSIRSRTILSHPGPTARACVRMLVSGPRVRCSLVLSIRWWAHVI